MGGDSAEFFDPIIEAAPGYAGAEQLSMNVFGRQPFAPQMAQSYARRSPQTPSRPKQAQAVTRKRRRTGAGDFTQLGTILTGPQGAILGLPLSDMENLLIGEEELGQKALLGE